MNPFGIEKKNKQKMATKRLRHYLCVLPASNSQFLRQSMPNKFTHSASVVNFISF